MPASKRLPKSSTGVSRLGFPVKVVGREGLKSSDTRRWQNKPHLRTSIEYLHIIFEYLQEIGITMYRISSDIAPYLTHPEKPEFRQQVKEARRELEALGKVARERRLRLSFHPSQYIVLNSPDDRLVAQSVHDIESQAEMLDVMELGRDACKILRPPLLSGHADFVNPFEFATFMRSMSDVEFDVMLEAKMKDVALLRLRSDLERCAPDVRTRFD